MQFSCDRKFSQGLNVSLGDCEFRHLSCHLLCSLFYYAILFHTNIIVFLQRLSDSKSVRIYFALLSIHTVMCFFLDLLTVRFICLRTSSSSCHAASMDLPDPLKPPVSIVLASGRSSKLYSVSAHGCCI